MKENCEQLRESLPFRNWVYHEDLHITLAFLGGAADEELIRAVNNVEATMNDFAPFPLQIQQLGIFGKKESPRVLWADLKESSSLESIQKKVYQACGQAGFQLETRPFRPHLTLARKWMSEDDFEQKFLEKWAEIQPEPILFVVEQLALYRTHLNKIPKYEAIKILT